MMRAKLIVAAMFAIHVSAAVVQTYKDAYGSVWYMTAINPPEWGEGVVGVNGYYPVKDNGSAYVYKIELSSSVTELRVPTALTWSSGGSGADAHPSIEYLTREATANHPYLTTVSVNRSTELRAPYFRNCGALKEFTYEGFSSRDTGILQNSKYAVQGGVLYDGQLTDLKKYPEGKDGDVFTVPASVVSLHQFTLSNTKLKKIVFEGNAPKITRAYSGDTWQTVSNTVVSGSQNLSLICYRQGASGWGRYWCGIPAYAIPKAVTGLVASQGTSARGVVLTWEANEVATRYAVYRADSATGTRAFIGETTWRASSYVDRTAIPRQEYAYWVVPWNEDVEGAVSGVVVGYADDPKFYFKEADGEAELVSCDCAGGPLEIPASSENGLPVTKIGRRAVSDAEGITSLTIPTAVRVVGARAFTGGSRLLSVAIPESVSQIGEYAFSGCALKQVDLPEAIETVADGVFFGCDALERVDLKSSVSKIGNDAFCGCRSLVSIAIPAGVTRIGNYAFEGCESLSSITIPESVTSIGEGAFWECYGLADADGLVIVKGVLYDHEERGVTEITIPEGVTRIGDSAFAGCDTLTTVAISGSVTSIDEEAFGYCESLTSVTIPSSVTNVGEAAFVGCLSLTSVIVETGDAHRVKEMLAASGLNVSRIEFVVRGTNPDSAKPLVVGDASAEVTGDADAGFVVKPSAGVVAVVVEIPNGVDAKNVRVVVGPDVKTVTPNGTAVRVVRGAADITDFLDIPAAVGGVIDLGAATVKPEFANEPLDVTKGAQIDLSTPTPQLSTSPTRKGLAYRLKEGATLEAMEANTTGDSTIGDGAPWTPKVTVKGGASGFYSIRVSK